LCVKTAPFGRGSARGRRGWGGVLADHYTRGMFWARVRIAYLPALFVVAAGTVLAQVAPPVGETQHSLGVGLYRQHKYAEAIQELLQAAKSEPPESALFQESAALLGQCYFMTSRNEEAIPWLEKAPPATEVTYMLANAYLRTGKMDQSERAFATLFRVDPVSAAGHLLAGQMMMKQEYEAPALDQLAIALKLDPRLPNVRFLLAETDIFRGRIDKAIDELKEERQLNPGYSMVYYKLGDAYTRREDWDLAIPQLELSVWLNPDYSGPYILLGKCYFKKQRLADAEAALRRALRLDPQNYSATYLLGQTLMALGRTEEGKQALEKSRSMPR
jgi:protein O-GlcNAc transferase